jgi:signal transduction histidine kinase
MYQMRRAAAKEKERMSLIIIVLAFAIIVGLLFWLFRHRKMQHHLLESNEQLKTALVMAEESDRMKTEFVRQVSHEVRTPLNAINGFNEVLNDATMQLSKEERQDLVLRIKENTDAITNIVDELLQLSEQESGDFYIKEDDIQCNRVFANIIYSYRDKVNPFVELNYTTEVINRFTIHSNEKAVTKIVDHLIQNAIKFTSKGSIELHCAMSDDQQSVVLSVTDTGRGVDKDVRNKIFDQFFKIDHFKQGMGLGLTVSKKIAQKLGGELELDQSYNEGSRFILTLPVS